MYEHLAGRPAQEKKDSRPTSQANYLNAPKKSVEKKFSLSDVRVRYTPQKTAQLKAHAFTKSSAALKKASPRGVIQRAVWMYDESDHQWHKKSQMSNTGNMPFPANPVDGMFFDDVTGEYCSPGDPNYITKYDELLRRRHDQALNGDYDNLNRVAHFGAHPKIGSLDTPFDLDTPFAGVCLKKKQRRKRAGKRNYFVSARGVPKPIASYDDISKMRIPKKYFLLAAKHMSEPPGKMISKSETPLHKKQRAYLAAYIAIQHVEDQRTRTGGTIPIAATYAASRYGFSKVKKNARYMRKDGTQAQRDVLEGKANSTQEEADMLFRFVPPSPTPSPTPLPQPPNDDDGNFLN